MTKLLQLYRLLFIITLALYIYLGKGIAYGYFAEFMMLLGLLLLVKERKQIPIITERAGKIMYLFLIINIFFLIRGFLNYGIVDTIRDSLVINYLLFSFIILLFANEIEQFIKSILIIYKYFPIIVFCLYILSLNNFFGSISFFGGIHVLYFKFGDISVHLLAAFLFQITGLVTFKKPYDIINLMIIFLLFSIAASYSRGGMLSFLLGLIIFYKYLRASIIKEQLKRYLKYLPILFIGAYLFLTTFKVSENFQGRSVGVEQVVLNFTSIFVESEEGGLNDNKLFRLLWWGQIIDYTFNGPYFIAGKGLGVNLAEDDQILTTDLDGELRSPHNFNLTILARYGVFIFMIWIYWVIVQIKKLRQVNLSKLQLIIICLQIAFLFNASFDVFLEGPMGAFPFWVFVGIDLIFSYFNWYNNEVENNLFQSQLNLK